MGILKNAKHEKFARLIVNGANATVAAAKLGYAPNRVQITGSEMRRNPKIAARIDELGELATERVIEKASVDKAWVMDQLVEIVMMGKALEPVIGKDGPTGEVKQNLAAANKALELIGKEFAMFVDRKVVQTGPLDDLGHDELKDLKKALDDIARRPSARSAGQITH